MKIKITTLLLCFFFLSNINAQQVFNISKTLKWSEEPMVYSPMGIYKTEIYQFKDAIFHPEYPSLPVFSQRIELPNKGTISVEVINAQYDRLEKKPSKDDNYLSNTLQFKAIVKQDRRNYAGQISFVPIIKSGDGQYLKVTSFDLAITYIPSLTATPPPPPNTFTSVLSDGQIFKISVKENGVHKLTHSFLKDLGIDIDNIDPRKIKLYGNGGGILPQSVSKFRYDDLQENTIQIVGEGDGRFDTEDFILFYGEGPHKWSFDPSKNIFNREQNVYDDFNYYFIKISSDNGLRVPTQNSIASTEYTSTTFNDFARLEEDKSNLLFETQGAQGSGVHWFGDLFNPTRERTYANFNFPNLITSEPVRVHTEMALRSPLRSQFMIEVEGVEASSPNVNNSVRFGDNEAIYAMDAKVDSEFSVSGDNIPVTIKYPQLNGDSRNKAWLDFIQINARRALRMSGDQMSFRDSETLAASTSTFQLAGANDDISVWDISDPIHPLAQEGTNNNATFSFGASTANSLKEFIAFKNNGNFLSAEAIGEIPNQNIHGLDNVDLLIVYHKNFEDAANQLAAHRADHSGLSVATALVDEIFNEFSSGSQDPTAIRDLSKMLYERSQRFKYLLLFGDGTFDYKDKYEKGGNFVIPYETKETFSPINAYPADDYFGLISNQDGGNLIGDVDIAIGRLPVNTPFEAQNVVNKIIHYDTNPSNLRDWRNRIAFVGDDEDNNAHLRQADDIATIVDIEQPIFNQDKVYFDAFQQTATAGGSRFPKAQEAINNAIFQGVLSINYLGHGGSTGWAQERVLTQDDIASWDNFDNLTLLVTATCSFTGYDEPDLLTAGEQVMLKPDGGAIALFTTVRAVFSSQNFALTKSVFDTLYQVSNERPTMGEILRIAKNSSTASDINSRKFTMIGDPSQYLAIPQYGISLTEINGNTIGTGAIDTIRALEKVKMAGFVYDDDGEIMTDFNGKIYPTVFDKKIQVSTLGQDENSQVAKFDLQKNILFKGVASVTAGKFEFTFVVPKDINYQYGKGKVSLYAQDEVSRDARGFYNGFIIGGTNPNLVIDDEGPQIEVYMNTEDFVLGGITDENPTLLVKLSDDNGINVVGNSIGHDLTGVLDNETQNTYILNDFYESELDDFTKGEVRFPLSNLAEGPHRIDVKAWDVANNSADGFTEFVVFSSEEAALEHVLNYPNPFTTSTNFQFEHNLHGQDIDVLVQVFSVSGKLIKSIEKTVFAQGDRVTDVHWDGTDDYGDRLARGVYLYKVKISAGGLDDKRLKSESEFERLVILK